jgi:ribosomal subunit interface protein
VDLVIRAVGLEIEPECRVLIEDRLARLAARFPELIRAHVTLKHGGHHRVGTEEVDIVANCAGVTLRAAKQEEHIRDAVHAALDALERELGVHHEVRRHFGKAPGKRPAGVIASVFTDRGYGFITTDGGHEVYFHRNALRELDFASLRLGLPVELEVERGERGLQASRVFPVGERMAT